MDKDLATDVIGFEAGELGHSVMCLEMSASWWLA
jgi:hypothetical protein